MCHVLTEKYLIISGCGLLVKEEKQNKTQRIGFPALTTNIYIHGNFPLYGIYIALIMITILMTQKYVAN